MTTATIIARRTTFDGCTVCVWSDGDLTGRFGHYYRGARVVKDVYRSLVIANEVGIFTSGEVGCLVKAANILAKKGSFLPGDLRSLASKLAKKTARAAV